MKELDLLIENYFTESFETSDLFRLVEQVLNEQENLQDVVGDIVAFGEGLLCVLPVGRYKPLSGVVASHHFLHTYA